MTEQEKINAEVQTKLALQDAKFNMFMQEMRDRDNQRAEDIREIRSSLDSMGKHVRNLAITSMAAIGGMVIAVGAMIVTVVYSIFKS
ncbi:MAG: hypothetical protein IKT98_01800 [Selenomonadaceae bacterium]|nr:hypothetical protein [Selenomonadaceae bacterium]